jgi:hypothetical protein
MFRDLPDPDPDREPLRKHGKQLLLPKLLKEKKIKVIPFLTLNYCTYLFPIPKGTDRSSGTNFPYKKNMKSGIEFF